MSKHDASILVVDDEREIVRALRRVLSAHGYTVLSASSGEEALEIVAKHRPDLVLLDLLLPGMSGLEVCRRVRATSNVPIIVLSVKDTERDKVEALDLGADDYVAKPFGLEEVLARVRVALRRTVQPPSDTETRFRAGPLSVDFALRQVLVEGREVEAHSYRVRPAQGFHHSPRQDSHAAHALANGLGRQRTRQDAQPPCVRGPVASKN